MEQAGASTSPPALTYLDVSAEAAAKAASDTGAAVAASLAELIEAADVVVVAVRPQHVAGVLAEAAPLLGDRALVSVAAGVSLDELRAALPADARVGRVMPNVAAALGLGRVPLRARHAGRRCERATANLFALAGDVVVLDEEHFDSATAVAGCMPGILAMLVRDFAPRRRSAAGSTPSVARQSRHRRCARRRRGDRPRGRSGCGHRLRGHARRHDGGRHRRA